MNFSLQGNGPVIVLSHALALDHDMWSPIADALASDHTVVCYDHRGHGDELARGLDPFSIDDLASDAAELIREVSPDRPVIFVGLSLGGMVGQALAARHPSLLRGLAVINSAAHYPDRTTWDARIQSVRDSGMQAIADASIERWLTAAFRQTEGGQKVVARLRSVLLRTDPRAYVNACEAIARMDLRAGDEGIRTPTLIVAGRQDVATPRAMSEAMAKLIPGARVTEIDAAHVSAAEVPAGIVLLLRGWMRTLAS